MKKILILVLVICGMLTLTSCDINTISEVPSSTPKIESSIKKEQFSFEIDGQNRYYDVTNYNDELFLFSANSEMTYLEYLSKLDESKIISINILNRGGSTQYYITHKSLDQQVEE